MSSAKNCDFILFVVIPWIFDGKYGTVIKTKKKGEICLSKSFTAQRRNEIASELMREGSVKAAELAERYDVSTETIRKDIIYLEEQGLAKKSYGGAIAIRDLIEQPISVKEVSHKEDKNRIAIAAASMIADNSSVLLDGGSSTYALAAQLTMRENLTVFTSATNIIHLLSGSNLTLFCIGGQVRPSSKCAVGDWALEQLNSLKVDIAFLGTNSFRGFCGPTSASYDEVQIKKAIVKSSNKTYLLADHTKFSTSSLFQICNWEDLSGVITNKKSAVDYPDQVEQMKQKTKLIFV